MIHQGQTLSVPMLSGQLPVSLIAPIVDRATAQALRRTTAGSGLGDTKGRSRVAMPSLVSSPTIRTLPDTSEEAIVPVPVVIMPDRSSLPLAPTVRPERSPRRPPLDVAWMVAFAVALSVTLALAIPLELFH